MTWLRLGPDLIFIAGALALVAFVVKALVGSRGGSRAADVRTRRRRNGNACPRTSDRFAG